jgi:hypothetical protein
LGNGNLQQKKGLIEKKWPRAKEVINSNRGALEKHLEWIEKNFPPQMRLYGA